MSITKEKITMKVNLKETEDLISSLGKKGNYEKLFGKESIAVYIDEIIYEVDSIETSNTINVHIGYISVSKNGKILDDSIDFVAKTNFKSVIGTRNKQLNTYINDLYEYINDFIFNKFAYFSQDKGYTVIDSKEIYNLNVKNNQKFIVFIPYTFQNELKTMIQTYIKSDSNLVQSIANHQLVNDIKMMSNNLKNKTGERNRIIKVTDRFNRSQLLAVLKNLGFNELTIESENDFKYYVIKKTDTKSCNIFTLAINPLFIIHNQYSTVDGAKKNSMKVSLLQANITSEQYLKLLYNNILVASNFSNSNKKAPSYAQFEEAFKPIYNLTMKCDKRFFKEK